MVLEVIIYIAFAVIAVLLVIMAKQLTFALKHFTPPVYTSEIGQEVDLPSVTVCIPARNEQHALTDCLQAVLESTYEKLEIIVLDDSSGDDTPALIKSFASEGVRFVKGKVLPSGWLGKNHALHGLLQEASGTYILYLDVDTRLGPTAIENTIRYAISNKATMVSVLPRREDGWRSSIVFSPLRYFWELIFRRRNSPASASNAWLIRRSDLIHRFTGFEQYKNDIQPEAKIADALALAGEYRFLMSTPTFGVNYEKKWRSQLLTSTRLLFPLFNKQAVLAIMALIDISLLLLPFAVLVSTVVIPFNGVHIVAAILALSSLVLYGTYTRRVWKKGWYIGIVLWPYILIQEFCLIIASVIQYKRKTVTWKGRVIRPEAQN